MNSGCEAPVSPAMLGDHQITIIYYIPDYLFFKIHHVYSLYIKRVFNQEKNRNSINKQTFS